MKPLPKERWETVFDRRCIWRFATSACPFMKELTKGEMEMDELKLNLSSKFMRGIVTKLITKAINKKTGYKIEIDLHSLNVEVIDGKAYIHVDADAEINNDELMKIVKTIKDWASNGSFFYIREIYNLYYERQ